MECLLDRIFARPLLASLLVGTAIHLLNITGYLLFYSAESVYNYLFASISATPLHLLITGAIPYAIPYLVTTIGGRITHKKIEGILAQFPGMNPDIILRFSNTMELDYINPAGTIFIEHHPRLLKSPIQLLPPETVSDLLEHGCQNRTISVDAQHEGCIINFNLRGDAEGNLFLTGRDVTDARRLQQRVNAVAEEMRALTDFLDQSMSQFDPFRFELFTHLEGLLHQLLAAVPASPLNHPSHLLIIKQEGDGFIGHIYAQQGQRLVLDPNAIQFGAADSHYMATAGVDDVIYANLKHSSEATEEFQQHFHPQVRAIVGTIRSFATYRGGGTAVIGFFNGAAIDHNDATIIKGIAIVAESLHRISTQSQQIEAAFVYTMDALARASEANDEDTGSHIVRLNEYAAALAQEMGLDDEFIQTIHYSAQMHDVGKIHVHPDILKKPGRLTDEEFRLMQAHPSYGAKILGDSPKTKMAADIAHYHHERYNGGGYPFGIKGEAIPLAARIVAIADVYDALRQQRVYKPAFDHNRACQIILEGDGRTDPHHLDPRVLQAFRNIESQMATIFERLQGR